MRRMLVSPVYKHFAALALLSALVGCGTADKSPAVASTGGPDPLALAKLEGGWIGSGAAQGLQVRISRAASSAPVVEYAFRGEQPTTPTCTAMEATLSCVHTTGLTTTYTASNGGVDFTAKGSGKDDQTVKARLERAR